MLLCFKLHFALWIFGMVDSLLLLFSIQCTWVFVLLQVQILHLNGSRITNLFFAGFFVNVFCFDDFKNYIRQFLTIVCAFDKKLTNSQKNYTIGKKLDGWYCNKRFSRDSTMWYNELFIRFGRFLSLQIHAVITQVLLHVSGDCWHQSSRTQYILVAS